MRWSWLLALALLVPGCVSVVQDTPEASSSPTPGPASSPDPGLLDGPAPAPSTATFVLLDRSFGFNRTQGTGNPGLGIGSHCAMAGWSLDPPRLWFNRWQPHESPTATATGSASATRGSSPIPDPRTSDSPGFQHMGVLVSRIDLAASTNTSFSSFGTAPTSKAFEAAGAVVEVDAAFGPRRTLAVLQSWEQAVSVDGQPLTVGVPHTVRIVYDYTAPSGDPPAAYAFEETLTFLLVGEATYSTVTTGNYCI